MSTYDGKLGVSKHPNQDGHLEGYVILKMLKNFMAKNFFENYYFPQILYVGKKHI